jgi:hypothetical protein
MASISFSGIKWSVSATENALTVVDVSLFRWTSSQSFYPRRTQPLIDLLCNLLSRKSCGDDIEVVGAPWCSRTIGIAVRDVHASKVQASLDGKLVIAIGEAGSSCKIDISIFDDCDHLSRG